VWGWAIYDWANSAFATTVMAGFFPIFFKSYWSAGANVNQSTAMLGLGNSAASLLLALAAPLLGALADRASARKRLLLVFAYCGAAATAGLFLIGKGQWEAALLLYVVGILGFSGANLFYDALLPEVAPQDQVDRVSGLGFALGYLGGGLLLTINALATMHPSFFGLPDKSAAVQFSFLSVAVWWGGFTLFTARWVPADAGARSFRVETARGAAVFWAHLKALPRLRQTLIFLAAYWFYIDAVGTIIRMAVDYGRSLGFGVQQLLLALIVVQLVGFPATLGYTWLAQRWGVRGGIFAGIAAYIGITLWGASMTHSGEFYILAVLVGLVQGGLQSLSRSYFTRLIPARRAGEFFGFYNMLGKFATIIGPLLVGLGGLTARWALMPPDPSPAQAAAVAEAASRWGISTVIVLLVIGGLLFWLVDEQAARGEVARLEAQEGGH
jgi:UMF1 family MFS transporter